MRYPDMLKVRQAIDAPEVADILAAIHGELAKLNLRGLTGPGQRVAITAGSRGIVCLPQVISTIVEEIRRAGADPFIVPAMGSHGGATAKGQLEVLRSLGITEPSTGAPIIASMETVELGRTPDGMPVYMDRHAYSADAIVLVNRVKVHSPWGEIGSGLQKMAAIGLGKQRGCSTIHAWSRGTRNLYRNIQKAAAVVLARAPIAFGVAVVDNAYARPARVMALRPAEIADVEPQLLAEARRLVARLPFDELDLLIVERIGKNISPAGLDPLVVGTAGGAENTDDMPRIGGMVVLDLTEESHGNALGLGLASFTTRRCVGKIDYGAMYMNIISANGAAGAASLRGTAIASLLGAFSRGAPSAARYGFYNTWRALRAKGPRATRLPILVDSDRAAIDAALAGIGPAGRARVARIKDTLHLDELWVSEALAEQMGGRSHLSLVGETGPLQFDGQGNLL
ncbi:MAG: nickel-dependent lactate racemase [Chloroflexi bacterium]|nr:nickel-dependent lactate racemase [Chloroflexota bacterium]